MSQPKTRKTDASVTAFLDAVEDDSKRADAYALLRLMREITGEDPAMWGESIVGFGAYQYKYASGHVGDWPLVGFSPRKRNLTLYIMSGFEAYAALLAKLGKFKTGQACLYINRLSDVDLDTLRELVSLSVSHMAEGSFS